jgi:ubiquinone/menaquinone biosynthesis C-methylase UbiE
LSTDIEWEKWGARDPYFSVLTHPRFRAAAITEEARKEFFDLGQWHASHVLGTCRQRLSPDFSPERVLDFGCGVGRVLLHFARIAREAVGVDISPSMLREAEQNAQAAGLQNVQLLLSDDQLSRVSGTFDLVHSCIVIQHIEIERGLRIFGELLRRITPGGLGAIHVTFGWDIHVTNYGQPPLPPPLTAWQEWKRASRQLLLRWRGQAKSTLKPNSADSDPEMQMNFYNLSQLMFMLQREGVTDVHTQLTDHGGAMGAFMFFRRPASAAT